MNERIQELANKATRIVETTDHCSGASESHTEVDLAKFAELIVRECAQVCRDQPNVFAMKLDRENCAIAIEEHFGVDE